MLWVRPRIESEASLNAGNERHARLARRPGGAMMASLPIGMLAHSELRCR